MHSLQVMQNYIRNYDEQRLYTTLQAKHFLITAFCRCHCSFLIQQNLVVRTFITMYIYAKDRNQTGGLFISAHCQGLVV